VSWGLALIKNAVNEGRDCVDTIASRLFAIKRGRTIAGLSDVCIVGAGPAGISASLRAIEKKLSYVTLEQDEFGGTVAKYPRQKLVLTSPVEFPMHGKFTKLQISKEEILRFWAKVHKQAGLTVNTCEKVDTIQKEADGTFAIETNKARYRTWTVILALGRRGTPRKLGVPGEELAKVMYGLIEAEAYTDAHILVVGGGDSAVEARLGSRASARQQGDAVIPEGSLQPHQRSARAAHRGIGEERQGAGDLQLAAARDPAQAARLEVAGATREIANDWVWVFAGGTPPSEFLGKVGVQIGPRDLTARRPAPRPSWSAVAGGLQAEQLRVESARATSSSCVPSSTSSPPFQHQESGLPSARSKSDGRSAPPSGLESARQNLRNTSYSARASSAAVGSSRIKTCASRM